MSLEHVRYTFFLITMTSGGKPYLKIVQSVCKYLKDTLNY